jgi:hypothetical protein
MYPPSLHDACFDELQLQLAPPPPPPAAEGPQIESAAPPRVGRADLPLGWRVSLIAVAVLLVLVGVAGLFLPGLQGIVTILAGVALLSLVSHSAHRFLQWSLGPWPGLLDKVENLRLRLHDWLHRTREKLGQRRKAGRGARAAARSHGARPEGGAG